jgi:release factor glutamine methyltransferase
MLVLGQQIHVGELALLKGPHPERARQDAEALMRHALGRDKAWLIAHKNDAIFDSEARLLRALVSRRSAGEPIQHIIGETEFYGLPFRVTPDVLIPRPETEHLVEKALELGGGFRSPRILDVGTGSGAIAVALAHNLPHAQITALDISRPALEVARENAERNGVSRRIRFLVSDLLASVADDRFEMVVSNPPYVATADRDSLSIEVREHEPALALFAGADGLDVYRRLIPAAFAVLEVGGFLALEIGYGQSVAVGGLVEDAGFDRIEFADDLQGIPRVVCGNRSQNLRNS